MCVLPRRDAVSALRGQTPTTSLPGGPRRLSPPARSTPPSPALDPTRLLLAPLRSHHPAHHWARDRRPLESQALCLGGCPSVWVCWVPLSPQGCPCACCSRCGRLPWAGEGLPPAITCPHLLPYFQPAGVTLVSVHCSPDDQMLWALDSRWNVHVRAGITEEMPVGTDWEHVPGRGGGHTGLVRPPTAGFCPVAPGWGPHQQSASSWSLGFLVRRPFLDPGGLWSKARGHACPANRESSPGSPTLCPGESRLSGRVGPSLLHPGSEDRHTPHLPAGLQACQLALSTRTVWARCPNGDLARRYGITDKNPAGDYWKKIPGNVTCVTGRCWVPGCRGWCRGAAPTRLALPNETHPSGTPDRRPAPGLCQGRLPGRGRAAGPPAGGRGGHGAG